jgi:hypothetical protein
MPGDSSSERVEARAAAPPATPEAPAIPAPSAATALELEERISCLETILRAMLQYGPAAALLQQLTRRNPALRAAVLRLRPPSGR